MRLVRRVMIDGLSGRHRQGFRNISRADVLLEPEVVIGYLQRDPVPGFEGMEDGHYFDLIFEDFTGFRSDRVLIGMERLSGS